MYNQTPIPTLGGTGAFRALAIGPQGQVVGFSDDSSGETRPFVFDTSGIRDLGALQFVIPPPFLGFTVGVGGAHGIGLNALGWTIAVGSSGYIPSPAAATALVAIIPLDQAFVVNLSGPGGPPPQRLGSLIPSPAPGIVLGNSQANAVNNSGQIVGTSDTTVLGPPRQAYLYDPTSGAMINIGTLAGRDPNTGAFIGSSEALGINNNGQIVGVSDTADRDTNGDPVRRAFLYQIGTATMTSLGTMLDYQYGRSPTLGMSEARAINDSGQIVGVCTSLDASLQTPVKRAFVFNLAIVGARMMADLGTFDQKDHQRVFHDLGESEAFAINNAGDIVGTADTAQLDAYGVRVKHAFRYSASTGQLEDLHAASLMNPGNTFVDATGINDAGQICGNVSGAAGGFSGIVLTP